MAPTTPLGALSEEEVVAWTQQRLRQACLDYNLVPPAPLCDGEALQQFFLGYVWTVRAACTGTAQDTGVSQGFPTLPARTPSPGSVAQADDPSVPFGSGIFNRSHSLSPPPSRNLAAAFEQAEQFARDDPLFRQDVMDSLREAAATVPIFVPFDPHDNDVDQAGYLSSPDRFDEESMGVPSPPRPKPKWTREDRSPQWHHMCRPRTKQVPEYSPAHLRRAGLGTEDGLPRQFGAGYATGSTSLAGNGHRSAPEDTRDQVPVHSPDGRGRWRGDQDGGRGSRRANSPLSIAERVLERGAQTRRRSADAAANGAMLPATDNDDGEHDANVDNGPSLQLGEEDWRRLVRLPDRPSMADLRQLAGVALAALLRANGLRRQCGWSDEDARRALVRWIEGHPRQALALPSGRLRLPRSPRCHRSSPRPRRSPSYDGMIETDTEGGSPKPA